MSLHGEWLTEQGDGASGTTHTLPRDTAAGTDGHLPATGLTAAQVSVTLFPGSRVPIFDQARSPVPVNGLSCFPTRSGSALRNEK